MKQKSNSPHWILSQVVGQEKLHMGALRGNEWMNRFAAKHCTSREILDFPKDQSCKSDEGVVSRYLCWR